MHKPLSKSQIKKLNKSLLPKVSENFDLIFLLQDVDDPVNVGSLFRIADGCGASLILYGKTPKPPSSGISMLARGLDRSVNWEYASPARPKSNNVDLPEAGGDFEFKISDLKNKGFDIIAVELTEDAVNYKDYKFKEKTCLILGNEAIGVYKKTLELCDAKVFVPMLGKGPSLNVGVAAGIVGYEVLGRFS